MSGLAVGARVRVKDSHGTASADRTGKIIGRAGGHGFYYWRVRLDDLASTWSYPDSSLELLGDVWGPPTGPMVYTLEQHDHQVEKATFRALFEAACNAVSALCSAAPNEARWLVSGDALEKMMCIHWKIIDTDWALAYAFRDVFGEFPSGGDS